MEDFKHLLQRIEDSLVAASAHYQIWFTLRGEGKALKEYYDDMNDHRYVNFFHAINAGEYKLMFIELGCLFDSFDKDNNETNPASIRKLRYELIQLGEKNIEKDFEIAGEKYKNLVPNIRTIRSKLMAHKDLGALSEEIHAENPITPDQIGELIKTYFNLIGKIKNTLFNENCCFLLDNYEKSTFALLETLRKGRSL